MAKITYLNTTSLASSTISTLTIPYPDNVNRNETLIMVVLCHDIGKTPTVADTHWSLVKNQDGATFGVFVYIHDHIIIPPISASVVINGLSNKLNCGYIMRFKGGIIDDTKLINAKVSRYNATGSTGNSGFITTVNNTMIVHIVGIPQNLAILSWTSTASLTWSQQINYNISDLPYILHSNFATSSPAPASHYSSFSYSFIAGSSENISISIALTPGTPPNYVLNLLKSF